MSIFRSIIFMFVLALTASFIYGCGSSSSDSDGSGGSSELYSLTYHSNYPAGMDNLTFVKYGVFGSALVIADNEFSSPEEKTFKVWNTKPDGTGTSYSVGESYTVDGNSALYAVWQINTYTITFDANGGTVEPMGGDYGDSINLPAGTGFTKVGYTLSGWNTQASGLGTQYAAGALYEVKSNETLYAVWQINTYAVTFDANGGTGTVEPMGGDYGDSINLPAGTGFTKVGYTLSGWNNQADGQGIQYAIGASYEVKSDEILCAVWTLVTINEAYYNANTIIYVTNEQQFEEVYTLSTLSNKDFAGKTVKLTSDIDMQNMPFDGFRIFNGTFDGDNKTISNMTINRTSDDSIGFVGTLDGKGAILNMKFTNADVKGANVVGCVAGSMYKAGEDVPNISNVSCGGTVNGGGFVGGITAINFGGTITESYNTGAVSGNMFVGGVAGWNKAGTITTSYNTGEVSGRDMVGGLAGNNEDTITTSYNTGAVSGNYVVGGLAGNNDGTITESYNTGTVNSVGSIVGGMAGYNGGTITESYNTGTVSGTNFVGGLVGYMINGGVVTASYNTGVVSCVVVVGFTGSGNIVGGVVGFNSNGGTLTASYNHGAVSGSEIVGGVAGYNDGTIITSYNTGAVSGSGHSVGGVAGYNGVGTITASYNIGAVNSSSYSVGGVAGVNNDGGTITASYNIGVISGVYNVGGIAGSNSGTITGGWFLKTDSVNSTLKIFSNQSQPLPGSGDKGVDGFTVSALGFTNSPEIWRDKTGLPDVNGVTARPVLIGVGEGK